MKIRHLSILFLVSVVAATAYAQEKGSQPLFSAVNGSTTIQSLDDATREPAGVVVDDVIDMTGIESWDLLDDADNIIVDVNIGQGNAVTGISWDVGIATVGMSWLSEATFLISNSSGSADPNAIGVNPGAGEDASGDMQFSSGGVVDFATNGLPNIAAGADGIIRLQFFESFDDNLDAIDANWSNAVSPVVAAGLGITVGQVLPPVPQVPTLSLFGMLALALVLALGTALVLRRKA